MEARAGSRQATALPAALPVALAGADPGCKPGLARSFGLDLVRAAAVTLVLLSHCGDLFARWFHITNLRAFSYGAFYGIELFFVLSGLLIGGLLIEQIDRTPAGGLPRAWRIFMIRRWMRTLPLYYLCLLAIALIWAPIVWPGGTHLADALLSYGTLLQNFAWPMRDGNFFDVSWSLAVEEWFYLGFSALLFALTAWTRRAALPVAALVFIAGPMALRWWLRTAPDSSDHLVIYWLDSIGIGVLAAWVAARRPAWFRAAAWLLPVGAGLAALTYVGGLARFGVPAHLRRCFDSDLLALALVLMLPAATRWRQARGPLAAAVRAISRYSYALYLTHLSVLIWVDYQRQSWHLAPAPSVALSVALIAGLSYAMSRWVERPIMARRPDDRPQPSQPHASNAATPLAEHSQAYSTPGGA
jgi:peptidoglycan/LPS O-acetylase OafA/YrhL